MAESTVVTTFAELAFLLRSTPAAGELVFDTLRVRADAVNDMVGAGGLASLLARGMCVVDGEQVVPTEWTAAMTGGLVGSVSVVSLASWVGTSAATAHVFSGPATRVALYPKSYGCYGVELLDPAEDVAAVLVRFLDQYVPGDPGSAALFQSGPVPRIDLVAVVDDAGAWHLSDSVATPDRAMPSSRDAVAGRLAQLFGRSRPTDGR